ncbi:hypothetical protein SPRG_02095 [Saprolegnia parasitica CBS 223.65]|uniref:Uncharacterized protein n=1 Tax=Saprolegnia parasitica (strain CBS 223.65) TaxID=695850 RepID=A0A067D3I8_SAPPC|nr:hypothetical protein SPRG_02095 [Saprolegnia parasitica CBS 223.65]KDO33286.1 hypothetical protein SPRG_02095 [Saprolegnia parasitica CBS 223.65]|eukprot:XP_012196036.1 hypothetical protein SPRG_02095 [Saprolegnia parasitica CBS 223.65]
MTTHAETTGGSKQFQSILGVVLLLTLLYWSRRYVLGRSVSWIASLVTGQRVRIQQMTLQPLTLSGIEVATTDGVQLQLSRLQVDVHLRAFLASFGQGKLLRLFLDDVIVTALPRPPPLSPPARRKRQSAKSTSALVGLLKFTHIHVKSLALRGMLAREDGNGFLGGLGLVRDLDLRIADATSATTSVAVVISHAELSVVAKLLETPSLDAISERPSLVVQANELQYTIELDYVQLLPQHIAVQGPHATDPSATVVLHAALLAYLSAMTSETKTTAAPRSAQPPTSFHLDTIALQMTFVHGPDDAPTELRMRTLVDAIRVTKQIESSGTELTLDATVRSGSVWLGDVTCLLWTSMTVRVRHRLTGEMETIEMTSDVGELSVHWSTRLRMLADATERAYQESKSSSPRPKVPLVLVVTLRCGQATFEAVDADKALKTHLTKVHANVAKTVDQSRLELEIQDGTWRLLAQDELLNVVTSASQLVVTEVVAPTKSVVVDMTMTTLEATLLGLPLCQLTQLHVASAESGNDVQQIEVGVDAGIFHWVFPLHAARLAAGTNALSILLWVQTIMEPPKPPMPSKKPVHLVLESKEMCVHIAEIPHVGACASNITQLHVHVQGGRTQVQVQHLVLRHDATCVIECSDLHLVDTKPTASCAASHLQVDLTSMSLVLGTHFRLLALVLQLQELMAPPRRDRSLPPPLKLDVNVRTVVATVLDAHQRPAGRLEASQYHVKTTLTPSSSTSLSDDHAALVRDLDSVLSFEVYRPLLTRLVVIDLEMDTGSIDMALNDVDEARVAHLQLRSLTLGGRLLDMAGDFGSVDARAPGKRLGVSLHIAGHGIALNVLHPTAVATLAASVGRTLVYALDTAVLEAIHGPRGNPRFQFFGEVDVSATDVALRYALTDDITAQLRVAQLQVVCDKTYRVDGHVTQLSVGLVSDIVLLARLSVVVHCVLDDRDRSCDAWSLSVAASIRALHETDCNGLLLEWASALAVLRALAHRLSAPLAPPTVSLDPPPLRFYRIARLALQVTIAPLQMAWWQDAFANQAFFAQAETLDVTLGLVEAHGEWTLPTCRIAATSTRAYELTTRDAKAGPIPFLRGPPTSFFLEATVLEYAKSTLPYIPIHLDECKLLWTVALRDHVCGVIDLVHRDVLGLQTEKGSTSSAPAATAPVVLPESVAPLSLLELLEQGKLGPRVSDAAPAATNAHETRDLVKLYQLDIEHVQINVLEPATKSSLVLASRLIHLEWGYDAAGVRSMADVQLKEMRCLVAPLDVDIGAGILWYKEAASSLLRPILAECALHVQYAMTLHNQATRIRVTLPSIELTVDSHQFFQCFSVVKHVLLAPPSTKKTVSSDASPRAAQKGGKRRQQAIADELRRRDLRSPSPSTALKSVAFEIGLAQCRLRTSPEDGNIEFVALALHTARGSHVFYDSLSTKFNLSLQWLEIQNLRPGASSMAFDDPMAVLTPRLATPQGRPHVDHRPGFKFSVDVQPLLSLRAESLPLLAKEFPPLRVFEVLEVSFFPGVAYDFAIQLAVDFYELMFTFFFGAASNRTESFGKKSTGSRPPAPVTSSLHPDNDDDADGDDVDVENEEVVFFNYVRVGNICLHLACSGFVVNLSGFGLDLPPFVCRSKLCTWKRLLRKFEVHLAWCVSKESASSGLHHVKKKLFALTKKTDKTTTTTKDDETTRKMLFGPYHPNTRHDATES